MDREEMTVYGQTGGTSPVTGRRYSPWTDRRYQSMDRQEAPVHGQTGDTRPWTER